MKTFRSLLEELDACDDALKWVGDRTVEKAVKECPHGNWIYFLATRVGIDAKSIMAKKRYDFNKSSAINCREVLGGLIIEKVNQLLLDENVQ